MQGEPTAAKDLGRGQPKWTSSGLDGKEYSLNPKKIQAIQATLSWWRGNNDRHIGNVSVTPDFYTDSLIVSFDMHYKRGVYPLQVTADRHELVGWHTSTVSHKIIHEASEEIRRIEYSYSMWECDECGEENDGDSVDCANCWEDKPSY